MRRCQWVYEGVYERVWCMNIWARRASLMSRLLPSMAPATRGYVKGCSGGVWEGDERV